MRGAISRSIFRATGRCNRGELEKLALYAGDGGSVSYDEAREVVGDSAEITLDDAIRATAAGDLAALERSLQRAFEEGESPVTALRAALRHFQRLYVATARMAAGSSPEDAISGLRPPVFYDMREAFLGHLAPVVEGPRRSSARGAARGRAQRQADRPAGRGRLPRRPVARRKGRPPGPLGRDDGSHRRRRTHWIRRRRGWRHRHSHDHRDVPAHAGIHQRALTGVKACGPMLR